jgi:hypothetical protein
LTFKGAEKGFFTSPPLPGRLWGPSRLLSSGYRGHFHGLKGRSLRLTAHFYLLTDWLSSMEQSPWETNSHPDSREIPLLLWNPKVHYRVHKGSPLAPLLSTAEIMWYFTCSLFLHGADENIPCRLQELKWTFKTRQMPQNQQLTPREWPTRFIKEALRN